MKTKFEATEVTVNGKTFKLSPSQAQALAVLNMPSLEARYQGYAVTARYTSHPEYYEGPLGKKFSQNPTIHHSTARSLVTLGLAVVTHNIYTQQFEVRAIKVTDEEV